MAALDNIASELLKSANEADLIYKKTRDQAQRDKAVRLRRIVENLRQLVFGASDLNGLSDVTLSAPANGQVLTYNSTTTQWENQTPGGGGGGGDMYKSTYDVDNDGIVDGSETTQIIVRNSTGSTLLKGQVVYLSGATGNRPNAVLSQANTEATSSKTIGIVIANIANNADGYIAVNGTLHDLDTSAFTAGDSVWLSATTAGAYTSTIPSEPNHTVFIGYIARSHPTQGRLVILIQNGYELNELHGVLISSEANNDLLVYETSTTLWKNKSISTIFGGTPLVSVPTLAQVTTAGNTTTNAITVGNATVNGPVNSVFAHTPTTNYTGFGGVQLNVADGTERGFFKLNPQTGEVKIGSTGSGYFTTLHSAGVERMRIFFSSGNVAINTTTDAGYKLDVNGTARVKGTGTTSATTAFLVQNSTPANLFSVLDDGSAIFDLTTSTSLVTIRRASVPTSRKIEFLSSGGARFYTFDGEAAPNANGDDGAWLFKGRHRRAANSGIASAFRIEPFFAQEQFDSIQLNSIHIVPTISVTGTATNVTVRGIYYNPTIASLTGVVAHRAIETTSGDVVLNTQSSTVNAGYTTVSIGGSSGVYLQMYVGANPATQTLRGQLWAVGNNLLLNNPSAGYLGLYTTLYSGVTVWPTTGNVYVGASPSTDAGYKLDVNGAIRSIGNSVFVGPSGSTLGTNSNNAAAIFYQTGFSGILAISGYSNGGAELQSYQNGGLSLGGQIILQRQSGSVFIGTSVGSGKLTVAGSITAASALAQGVYFNNTLVAAANNDVLVGLDINPTFTNGAFTGVSNLALRIAYVAGRYISFTQRPGYTDYGRIQFTNVTGADITSSGSIALTPGDGNLTLSLGNGLTSKITTPGSTKYDSYGNQTPSTLAGTTNRPVLFTSTIPDGSIDGFIFENTSSGSRNLFKIIQNNTTLFIVNPNGNTLIGTTTDSGYKLDVNGQFRATGESILASASGNVGIGTVSPTSKLHINGADPFLRINNVGSTNTHGIKISYNSSDTQGFHLLYNPATAVAYLDNTYLVTSGQPYGDIYFRQNVSGTMTTRMTIKADGGNVGIGTSSPTDKFHIVDNTNGNKFARISAGGTDASAAWVAQNDQVDNIVYRVFGSAVTGTQMGISLARSASLLANLGGSGKFLIGTFSSTDFVMGTGNQERIRLVDSTGNFLVGTTTDLGNKLEVSGTVNATAYKINNTAGYTGILNIPTNPPGMQNVDIQSGIVVNIF